MPRILFLTFLTLTLPLLSCGSDCKKLKAECNKTIESKGNFRSGLSKEIHFGVTMRDTLVQEFATRTLIPILEKGLQGHKSIGISKTRKVRIKSIPKLKRILIRANNSCDHCVRISGEISGNAEIEIPILGSRRVPLDGNLSIVAPLIFVPTSNNTTALKIDLAKTADFNPEFINASLKQIPSTWSRVFAQSFSKQLKKTLLKELKPVTIFEFNTPNFGIANLKMVPSLLKTNAKNHSIFIGFASNLTPSQNGPGLKAFNNLKTGRNLAIGIDPRILSTTTSALMQSGKMSRTYTKEGKSDKKGPISITMNRFEFGKGKNTVPLRIGFRYWQLPTDGSCLWADVEAQSELTTSNGKLAMRIKGYEVKESSLPKIVVDFTTWIKSTFSDNQSRVIIKALSESPIKLPNQKKLIMQAKDIEVEGGALWLQTFSTIQ